MPIDWLEITWNVNVQSPVVLQLIFWNPSMTGRRCKKTANIIITCYILNLNHSVMFCHQLLFFLAYSFLIMLCFFVSSIRKKKRKKKKELLCWEIPLLWIYSALLGNNIVVDEVLCRVIFQIVVYKPFLRLLWMLCKEENTNLTLFTYCVFWFVRN